jgi:hypothetical protein
MLSRCSIIVKYVISASCFFPVFVMLLSVMPAVNSLLYMLLESICDFYLYHYCNLTLYSNCHRMIKMSLWSHLFAD